MKNQFLLPVIFIGMILMSFMTLTGCSNPDLSNATTVTIKVENFSVAPEYRSNYFYFVEPGNVSRKPVEPTEGKKIALDFSEEKFMELIGMIESASKAHENDCDGCHFVTVKVFKNKLEALKVDFAGNDGNDDWWEIVDYVADEFGE